MDRFKLCWIITVYAVFLGVAGFLLGYGLYLIIVESDGEAVNIQCTVTQSTCSITNGNNQNNNNNNNVGGYGQDYNCQIGCSYFCPPCNESTVEESISSVFSNWLQVPSIPPPGTKMDVYYLKSNPRKIYGGSSTLNLAHGIVYTVVGVFMIAVCGIVTLAVKKLNM